MTMLSGMFFILCVALTVGIVVSIVIFVPLCIYIIPYRLWLGFQQEVGKYKEQKDLGAWKTVQNASKLYTSWMFRRDLTF